MLFYVSTVIIYKRSMYKYHIYIIYMHMCVYIYVYVIVIDNHYVKYCSRTIGCTHLYTILIYIPSLLAFL